jgi:hypothetical protein
LQEDARERNLRRKKGDELLGCSGRRVLRREQCNGFSQGVHRQRLCKHRDYATIEENSVFCAVRVAPRTLLSSAEANTSLVVRRQYKRLDDTRVGGHVVTACSAVTSRLRACDVTAERGGHVTLTDCCAFQAFTAVARCGSARHGRARLGTEKTPLRLLLRNRGNVCRSYSSCME